MKMKLKTSEEIIAEIKKDIEKVKKDISDYNKKLKELESVLYMFTMDNLK